MLRSMKGRVIGASVIGSSLELYDFILYGVFSPVLAALFFPTDRPETALLAALATFAAGYGVRPFGAAIFGHIGDRWGRKRALALSITLMAVPTFVMGILPTYATLGVAAPIILIGCRLLQGLAIAGEYYGAIIFLIEHLGARRAGLASALVASGGCTGAVLAYVLGSICTHPALPTWSWRVPFLLGTALMGIGAYIRYHLAETPLFVRDVETQHTRQAFPLRTALRHNPGAVVCSAAGAAFAGPMSSAMLAYLPIYLLTVVGVVMHQSLLMNSGALLFYVAISPLVGLAVDRFGTLRVMTVSCIGVFTGMYGVFALLQMGSLPAILAGQGAVMLLTACFSIPLNAFLVSLFPTNTRYSGASFGYNIGMALMGGSFPLVATYLIQTTGDPYMPAYALMVCSLFGGAVVLAGRRWGRQNSVKSGLCTA